MIKNVAEHIGVTASCINYWEPNSSSPEVSYLAAIIDFLGWNLLPPAAGIGELVVRQRTSLGLTHRQAARIGRAENEASKAVPRTIA